MNATLRNIALIIFILFPTFMWGQALPGVPGVGVPVGVGLPNIPWNVISGYPNPYANEQPAYRSVYLYKAEEFGNKQGSKQSFWGINFEVEHIQGVPLKNFTIRLKQVNWDEMPADPDTDGMEIFHGPTTYRERQGKNYHGFNKPFCWDGTSNVLVEVCVTNPEDEKSLNASIFASVPYDGKNMSWHEWNDEGKPICDAAQTYNAKLYEERPATSFHILQGDKQDLALVWSSLPKGIIDSELEYPVNLKIRNIGCVATDSVLVGFQWRDSTIFTDTVAHHIPPGGYYDYTFNNKIFATPLGLNDLKIWIGGFKESNPKNDTLNKLIWVKGDDFEGLDYSGKDFWLAFMANYDNGPSLEQSLFFTSPKTANVKVSFPLLGWEKTFSVSPDFVYTLDIPTTVGGLTTANNQSEAKRPTSIHIESDENISVYGMSNLNLSTDAFLAIPKRTVGTEYRVIAPQGIFNPSGGVGTPLINAPAEFIVVANEDNTLVEINPVEPTENHKKGELIYVTLNKGENYLVKAAVSKDKNTQVENGTYDLTGTRIRSDKPVSVISGSQCGMIPGITSPDKCESCDHLLEQLTPPLTWGKQFIVSDFAYKPGDDILRVYNAETTNTTVKITGSLDTNLTIPAETFTDIKFQGGIFVDASAAVQVMHMCTGGQCEPKSNTDPFITNIIPSVQWGTNYSFATATSIRFTDHFITVIKKSKEGRIAIDGNVVRSTTFKDIGNGYFSGKIQVQPGSHRVVGDSTFCVYVYGFGRDDSYGYPASGSFLDVKNVPPLEMTVIAKDATCHGYEDGIISFIVNGGTPPYNIMWDDGDTTSKRENLPAGEYKVTVTDQFNFEISKTISLYEYPLIETQAKISNVKCNGNADGSIELESTIGGVAPYVIHFENYGDTNSIIDIPAGDYPFQITDSKNCFIKDTLTLFEPEEMSIETEIETPSCHNGNDASILINSAGGFGSHTIFWPQHNSSEKKLENITPGNHSVIITDKNNCKIDTVIAIENIDPLAFNLEVTPVGCFRKTLGKVLTSLSGGYGNYTYKLGTGQSRTEGVFVALNEGSYTLTGSDGRCSISQEVEVLAIASPNFEITTTDANCGGWNGTAKGAATGGTGNYTFQWITKANYKVDSVGGLPAGLHRVLASDEVCEKEIKFQIGNIEGAIINITPHAATCKKDNGFATVRIRNYTGAYSATFNDDPVFDRDTIKNIPPGIHKLHFEDDICNVDKEFEIEGIPSFKIISPEIDKPDCNKDNGSAKVRTTNSSSTIHYDWKGYPGNDSPKLENIPSGVYKVWVQDSLCLDSTFIQVTPKQGPKVETEIITPASCGENNGYIKLKTSGGSGDYEYFWEGYPTNRTSKNRNLSPGIYNVTVDDGACPTSTSITVPEIPQMELKWETQSAHCNLNDGSATATIIKGIGVIQYNWSHESSLNGNTASGLSPGEYQLTLQDDYCLQNHTVTIHKVAEPSFTHTTQQETCELRNGQIALAPVTHTGQSQFYLNDRFNPVTDTIYMLSAGKHKILMTDGFCWDSTWVNINAIPLPVVNKTVSEEYCNKQNGSATVNIVSANGNYNILWENGMGTETITNLPLGTYTFEVTDDYCTLKDSVLVGKINGPVQTIISQTPTTCDLNNGEAEISVSGNESSYNTKWLTTPAQQGTKAANLSSGVVKVVSYSSTCTDTMLVTIPNIPKPSIAAHVVQPAHCNGTKGIVAVSAQNVSGTPLIKWNNTAQTKWDTIVNIATGTYAILLEDDNCQVTTSITIPPGKTLQIDSIKTEPETCEKSNGSIQVFASENVSAIQYIFENSTASSNHITNLNGGLYEVKVQDQFCEDKKTVLVSEIKSPAGQVTTTSKDACGNGLGEAVFVASTQDVVSYEWDGISGHNSMKGLKAGNHTVTISNGTCNSSYNFTVGEYKIPEITYHAYPAFCGNANGSLAWSVSGETAPYITYLEGIQQNEDQVFSLSKGEYMLQVEDKFGCLVHSIAQIPELWLDAKTAVINHFPQELIPPVDIRLNVQLPENWQAIRWYIDGDTIYNSAASAYMQNLQHVIQGQVEVLSSQGCVDVVSFSLMPDKKMRVYIPNSFSPNNDTHNDKFSIRGVGIAKVQGSIYNRWGEKIHEITRMENAWDGKYNNEWVQTGIYPFEITVTSELGEKEEILGVIQVLR